MICKTFDSLIQRLIIYDHIKRNYEKHNKVEDIEHEFNGYSDFVRINRYLKHALDRVLNHSQNDDLFYVEAMKLVAAYFESREYDQKV